MVQQKTDKKFCYLPANHKKKQRNVMSLLLSTSSINNRELQKTLYSNSVTGVLPPSRSQLLCYLWNCFRQATLHKRILLLSRCLVQTNISQYFTFCERRTCAILGHFYSMLKFVEVYRKLDHQLLPRLWRHKYRHANRGQSPKQ